MSSYFGPFFATFPDRYFDQGGEVVLGIMGMVVVGRGSMTATLEAVVSDERSGGVANTWALTPKTREEWERERIAAGPVSAPQVTPQVTPEVAEEKGQIVPLFINPAMFTNAEQTVLLNAPALTVEDSATTLDDDELAACALVILQARANSYRRLRTGSHLPFSRAA